MLYFELECKKCKSIFTKETVIEFKETTCPKCGKISVEDLKILLCRATNKIDISSKKQK